MPTNFTYARSSITMNQLILLPKDQLKKSQSNFILKSKDPRFLHIKNHLKLALGSKLKVALLNEGRGVGLISELDDKNLKIEIKSALIKNPDSPYLEAVIGLGRPKQMLKILEYGTQLGVSKFQIIKCQLSDKSYLSSPLFDPSNINQILIKALSQSAYFYNLPTVEVKKYFPRSWKEDHKKIALDPVLGNSDSDLVAIRQQNIQFVMGPERGLTDDERKKLKLYDFEFHKLGPSILKSEVAFNFFLGQLNSLKDLN